MILGSQNIKRKEIKSNICVTLKIRVTDEVTELKTKSALSWDDN